MNFPKGKQKYRYFACDLFGKGREVIFIAYALLFFVTLAVCFDFWQHRIPNRLLIAGCYAGLLGGVVFDRIFLLCKSLFLLPFLFVILFLLYRGKVLGAGDVKLFLMTAFYLEVQGMVTILWMSFLLAAILGLIKLTYFSDERSGIPCNKIHFSFPILVSVLYVCR